MRNFTGKLKLTGQSMYFRKEVEQNIWISGSIELKMKVISGSFLYIRWKQPALRQKALLTGKVCGQH